MTLLAVPILVPPPELTDAQLPEFTAMIAPYLTSDVPGVVLDMAAVQFIGSSGLGQLVKIGMALDGANRRLALARVPRGVERSIRLIGLETLLPLFKHLKDASAYVAGSR